MPALLDPKLDVVFKRLFAEAPDLLVDLINAVRQQEPAIVDVEIINPHIAPEEISGKTIVLDILARDLEGRLFSIEMQTRQHIGWPARSVYYLARSMGRQLQAGGSYRQIQPVIGIHLLDFNLFAESDHACWAFELRDRQYPHVVLDRSLQLYMLELPKADRLYSQAGNVLANWVSYFKHWHEENVMQHIEHPPVQQAYRRLRTISEDDKAWVQAELRHKLLHDEATLREEAEIRAAEAVAEAEIRAAEAVVEAAAKGIAGPLSAAVERNLDNATLDQLAAWAERILFVERLDQVFTK